MERYFKRKIPSPENPLLAQEKDIGSGTCDNVEGPSKQIRVDMSTLPVDPADRKPMCDYLPKDREEVRREYLRRGPFQPRKHDFPQKNIGGISRRFNSAWLDQYPNWLEYSIKEDAAYCLCCYLFRHELGNISGGEAFVSKGFSSWNKKDRLKLHVGEHKSVHNKAAEKCEALLGCERAIQAGIEAKEAYRIRLSQLVDCVRFILCQGFPLCGLAFEEYRRERDFSSLLELCDKYGNMNILSGNVSKTNRDCCISGNACGKQPMATADTQKDIMCAASKETTMAIVHELGGDSFGIVVDCFEDVSYKDLIAVALRFVDSGGMVKERFIGIVEVMDVSVCSLKAGFCSLLSEHGLSLSRIRGQSYNAACGVSNRLCGLKNSIIGDNKSAYYTHCFTLQLHSALVAAAKHQFDVFQFFEVVYRLFSVIGSPCTKQNKHEENDENTAGIVEPSTNYQGPNERDLLLVSSLKGVNNSRWIFCYEKLVKLVLIFSSVIKVLEFVETDGVYADDKVKATRVLDSMYSFDFVICLHLMCSVLGITAELSLALQRTDCDIANAASLSKICKQQLQTMRNEGWEALFDEVSSLCNKHDICIPNMDDMFPQPKSRRNAPKISNLQYYRNDLFCELIDIQLQVLENCFDADTVELLLCIACLNPSNSFHDFDKMRLVKLARFYPDEFNDVECLALEQQLENYIIDVRSDERFGDLNGLGELSRMLVETKKHAVYHLVYALLKLALILPVSTPTMERAFSAMKLIETKLNDQICDKFMNDSLVTYLESDVFDGVSNDAIMHRLETMKACQ